MSRAALLAALLAAALAGAARADDDRPSPAPAPVKEAAAPEAKATHCEWEARGEKFGGWPVAHLANGANVIVRDSGELATLPPDVALKAVTTEERLLAALPSGGLAAGLAHADEEARNRCEELLRGQGAAAVPALAGVLDAELADARARALELLAKQPTPKLAGAIRARLGDGDEQVRKFALRAYAALAPADLVERCVALLARDDSVFVRHEAIIRIGRSGDVKAIDPLFDHLAGCDERSLRLVTFDALRRLTAHDLGRDEEKWRAWWTNHRDELLRGDAAPTPPAR